VILWRYFAGHLQAFVHHGAKQNNCYGWKFMEKIILLVSNCGHLGSLLHHQQEQTIPLRLAPSWCWTGPADRLLRLMGIVELLSTFWDEYLRCH
jgi:hypothetical protein